MNNKKMKYLSKIYMIIKFIKNKLIIKNSLNNLHN